MVSSATLDVMTKLIVANPDAPGPMLGIHPQLNPRFVRDDKLQDDLEEVLKLPDMLPPSAFDPKYPKRPVSGCKYGFAVVDLTDDPALKDRGAHQPAYAGWNDTAPLQVDSLAKLLALYGAYQLRADLRVIAKENAATVTTIEQLAKVARARYHLCKAVAIRPAEPAERPRIETFFTLGAVGQVDFVTHQKQPENRPYNDADLSALSKDHVARRNATTKADPTDPNHKRRISRLVSNAVLDHQLALLGAREQMRLMVGWSDNVAAATVIQSLGFPYLWALALRSGLFRRAWEPLARNDRGRSGPGGLVLKGDYNYSAWNEWPRYGIPAHQPFQGAHARSVATLLTVLAQEDLIDHEAHVGMAEMLRVTGPDFENSPTREAFEWNTLGKGMHTAGWIANQVAWDPDSNVVPPADAHKPLAVSKIGWAENSRISNALLVRGDRTIQSGEPDAGKPLTITAVLIALDAVHDDLPLLEKLGTEMAKKLYMRHKVT
jgi:hypothetical protein